MIAHDDYITIENRLREREYLIILYEGDREGDCDYGMTTEGFLNLIEECMVKERVDIDVLPIIKGGTGATTWKNTLY